ncbi:MAG TPA: hypothetical protein VKM54_23765 [Myxococcota bacterium]|nr:hypothetical protein [Myxococcota bacterium]
MLEAGDGLALQPLEGGAFRIAWGEPDWVGPIALRVEHGGDVYMSPGATERPGARALSPRVQDFEGEDGLGRYRGHALAWSELPLPLLTTVRAYKSLPVLVFRIEALSELSELTTGAFERTSVAWPALMVESFFGVRGLREAPGRAHAWQEGLDRAAGEYGLTLQWCMGTPADWLQTVTLNNITSVRTSGDYRYLFDNGLNWVWFLHGNAFARALGLHPYKDVFLTHGETGLGPGEKYVEAESLLASLSAGPVGIGDRLGHTDREIVLRSCRPDGVLVKPDVPIAACDRCFRESAFFEKAPLVGETYSLHPAGRWRYVVSLNAGRAKEPMDFRVELADLGMARPEGAVILYDWRRRAWTRLDADGGWDVQLQFQDFDYRVVCPLLPGGITLFGDVSKWATVGDQRIAQIEAVAGELCFDLLGAPLERVEVRGWSARAPGGATAWCPGGRRVLPIRSGEPAGEEGIAHDRETGFFVLAARLGREGRSRIRVSLP